VIQQWDHGGLEAHEYLNLGPLLLQTLTAPSGFIPPPVTPAIDRGVRKRRQIPREFLPPDPIEIPTTSPAPADEIPIADVAPDLAPAMPVLADAIARDPSPRITTRPILHLPPKLKRQPVDTDPVLDDDDELLLLM
jgi:hypothetical protein